MPASRRILEALTYALYNGSTWDQRGSRSLISTGANVMRVELDFTAEGEQWRIVPVDLAHELSPVDSHA